MTKRNNAGARNFLVEFIRRFFKKEEKKDNWGRTLFSNVNRLGGKIVVMSK